MSLQFIKTPAIMLMAVFLASCSGMDEISITSVDNFKFMEIDENIVTFSADIGVSNPSTVGFRVRELDLATSADGIYLGNLKNTEALKIPARSDSVYNMVFNMRLSNILSMAGQIVSLSRKNQVNLELKGFIRSTSGLVSRKIEISESRIVDVPQTGFF